MRTLTAIAAAVFSLSAQAGIVGGPNDHMGHGMPEINAALVPKDAAPGYNAVRVMKFGDMGLPSDIGAWRTTCTVSKMAWVDPIVFPGEPGRSHLHTFFGNTGVDENSTFTSLISSGGSTCFGGLANMSVYWVPSMIDTLTGMPLMPRMRSSTTSKATSSATRA
jgi:hypothetical protein